MTRCDYCGEDMPDDAIVFYSADAAAELSTASIGGMWLCRDWRACREQRRSHIVDGRFVGWCDGRFEE